MKNNVWVAVSFSMLSGIATANLTANAAQQVMPEKVGQKTIVTLDICKAVNALELNQMPTFEDSMPCVVKN
jgi:hypothetical protein